MKRSEVKGNTLFRVFCIAILMWSLTTFPTFATAKIVTRIS